MPKSQSISSRKTCKMLAPCPYSTTDTCKLEGNTGQLFLTLVTALFANKCAFLSPKDMPLNVSPHLLFLKDTFDFIVVGAGSAGAVVAARLAEANPNWDVLLLEAGGYPPVDSQVPEFFGSLLGDERYDWNYKTEPTGDTCRGMVDGRCAWNRGKMLGGSSSLNLMAYLRGNKEDYNEWARLSKSLDWRYENVLEYYKRLENVTWPPFRRNPSYGTNGSLQVSKFRYKYPFRQVLVDAYQELGYQIQPDAVDIGVFDSLLAITAEGRRSSTAQAFLKPRSNLFIATDVLVTKILTAKIHGGSLKATGIEVVCKANRRVVLRHKKELVISAGSINTPQLLMLSGIGPGDHLNTLGIKTVADLKVGYNLQDHFVIFGLLAKVDAALSPEQTQQEVLQDAFDYFINGSGPYGCNSIEDLMFFVNTTDNSSSTANSQFIFKVYSVKDKTMVPFFKSMGYREDILTRLTVENQNKTIVSYCPILLHPKSRGRILLQSTNPRHHPLIYSGHLTEAEDVQIYLSLIEVFKKVFKTKAFASYKPEFIDYEECSNVEDDSKHGECLMRLIGSTMWHPVGTCKMGSEDDNDAVVNAKLQVRGIGKLRVIDASIMPTITRGNTNGPTMAIGELGAQFILDDWKYKNNQ